MKKTFIILLCLGFLICCGNIGRGVDLRKYAMESDHRNFVQNKAAYTKLFANAQKIGYGHENLTAEEWYKNVSKSPAARTGFRHAEIGDTGSIAGNPVCVIEILDEKTCRIEELYANGKRTGSTVFLEGYSTEELIPYLKKLDPFYPPVLFVIGEVKVVGKKPVSHYNIDAGGSNARMYPVFRLILPADPNQKSTTDDKVLTPEEIAAQAAEAEAAKLAAGFHTWTYKGKKGTIDARFLSLDKQTLTLEDRDGNEIKVKTSELIKEDLAFSKSEIERLEKEKTEALTRTWTVQGSATEAVFISTKNGKVTLRSTQTNTVKTFALALLSPDDRQWIEEILAGN